MITIGKKINSDLKKKRNKREFVWKNNLSSSFLVWEEALHA